MKAVGAMLRETGWFFLLATCGAVCGHVIGMVGTQAGIGSPDWHSGFWACFAVCGLPWSRERTRFGR